MRAGVVAAVAAALPLKSALAEDVNKGKRLPVLRKPTIEPATDVPPSISRVEQLNYYTKSTFAPYVNSEFRVYIERSSVKKLTLTEVADYLNPSTQVADSLNGTECFSLLFAIPPAKPFTQETYLIEHDALGEFYMFLVPVSQYSKKKNNYYEAVVYRRHHRQQYADGQKLVFEAESNVAGAPEQNRQRAYQAAPLFVVPGGQNADVKQKAGVKDERDIYRFRPTETESPTSAEQANAQRAKRKEIYPLTLAQSPIIRGLKLGMTAEQVLALFPGSKTDEDVRSQLKRPPSRFGVSSFKIVPEKYSSAPKFKGVSQILFTLLDSRVSTLYVGYDGGRWEHVDELVTKFSEPRGLPAAENWEAYVGMDDQLKTLKCKEFEISLFAGGKNLSVNYAQVRDLVALKKYKERVAKAKKEG